MSNAIALEPRPHKITVAEYFRMGEIGVLEPETRVELLEGKIFDMAPVGSPHSGQVIFLHHRISQALGDQALVSSQNSLLLGDLSAPEPDVTVLKPDPDYYRSSHPKPDDALLIIEVSDTSLSHDRERKLPLYARFEIPEVWLVDINGKHLDVFRRPEDGLFASQHRVDDLSRVGILAFPDIALDLSGLF